MTRILVTGASGFVGRALVAELADAGHSVRAAMRQPADIFPRSVEVIAVSDLTRPVEWRPLLRDIDTVVHLAGIAHAGPEIAEQAYDRVNRLATAELAAAARIMGIKHLVFMSSIRAQSGPASDSVLRESDAPRPTDFYGRSKLAAEDALRAAGVPFTILRPVLIYGPGVKGNFARLMALSAKTMAVAARPLPQPPLAAGAAKSDRRRSLHRGVIRGQKRNLCGGRSRSADFGRDRDRIARGRRARSGIVACAAGADCTRRGRARPRRRMAAPGRRRWSPIPPGSCRPDGSLCSIRGKALGRSRAGRNDRSGIRTAPPGAPC